MPPSWKHLGLEIVRSSRSWNRWKPNQHLDADWFYQHVTEFDLWYVFVGKGWLRDGERFFELQPGSTFCLKPGHPYEAGQDESDRLGIANVHFNFLDAGKRRLPPGAVELPDFHFHNEVSNLLDSLLHRVTALYRASLATPAAGDGYRELAAEIFRVILLELDFRSHQRSTEKATPSAENRYRVVDRFIEQLQKTEGRGRNIGEVARQMGLSADHLIRMVKRQTGRTPKALILEMRTNEARYLLETTSLHISEIAEQLGYRDIFSFSQQFKARTGLSPSLYRQRAASPRGGS